MPHPLRHSRHDFNSFPPTSMAGSFGRHGQAMGAGAGRCLVWIDGRRINRLVSAPYAFGLISFLRG